MYRSKELVEIKQINANLTIGTLDLDQLKRPEGASRREIQDAGKKLLLESMTSHSLTEVRYSPHGKPYFAGDERHLSISHSHGRLVIAINNNIPVGVDVELKREQVRTITRRFMSPEEIAECGGDVEALISWWSAKEALYKLYGMKQLDFREQMRVWREQHEWYGEIKKGSFHKRYRLLREVAGEYVMMCTLDEL